MMKKLLAVLLSLVLVVSFFGCAPKEDPADDGTAASGKSFTLVVVHGDGSEKEFSFVSSEKFVGPVLQAEGIIEGNDGPYGLEITKVDGETAVYATDGAYWAVYEGEEYALQGIDTTPIVDGGVYKLVYTKG